MNALQENWPKHPMFSGLPAAYIDLLARTATEEMYRPCEIIFHDGDPAERFYLIVEGSVLIDAISPEKGPITIATLVEGEVLGWSWLLKPYRFRFNAQAMVDTLVIAFDAVKIRRCFAKDKRFGYEMLSRFLPIVGERLQAARHELVGVDDHRLTWS